MKHRYPGPRSFTGDDRPLFFGRDAEKQELFRLIVLNDLVVLFGESGSGKTSLLQAGVCPDLEDRQYKPVFIRLNNPAEPPELQVYHQLKEGGYLPDDLQEDRTLWEYFSRFWYVDLGEVFTPVIVFDQFEELFTLYQSAERANFIRQFAAIANQRPPAGLPPEALTPPKAKFVFSLRSDFLYLLDELSADIPAILRCRFQLRLLDPANAKDAITKPAAMTGAFASPSFKYSAAALEEVLKVLSRGEEEITPSDGVAPSHPVAAPESLVPSEGVTWSHPLTTLGASKEIAAFQLQLVCRRIEDSIIHEKSPAGFQVTPDFYKGEKGIRQIIDHFYKEVIEKIDPAEQEFVEKLLARGLIRNGRRIMMEASAMREEYRVSQAVLERLHDERLLKREARKGELYYEISHDTLVKPILERFKRIEVAEREAEAERLRLLAEEEKRRADEAEKLRQEAVAAQKVAEEEKRKAQKMTFFAIGLSALASLATLGAGYLYDQSEKDKVKAEEQKTRAEKSEFNAIELGISESKRRKEADMARYFAQRSDSLAQIERDNALAAVEKARQEQINRLLADANAFRKDKRFLDALRAYKSALNLSKTAAEKSNITTQIIQTNREKNDADFERNREVGLGLKDANQCLAAIPYLEKAQRARPQDETVKKALADCKTKNPRQ